MIPATMAVAAVGSKHFERADAARAARFARFRALLVDLILFGFISLVVNSVYGVTQLASGPTFTIGGGTYTTAVAWPWLTLIWILYFLIPEAMFGTTPGKYWMRLKVVRLDGLPLDLSAVVIRNVLRLIDGLPILYLLGGLFVISTTGSQRLGDLAAGTTVVYQHHASEPGATRMSGLAARRVLAALLASAVVFTIGFDYFGRPPLVIEGDVNRHSLIGHLDSYTLGQPTGSFGSVTYPLYGRTGTQICAGSIELKWQFLGWGESSSSLECVPS